MCVDVCGWKDEPWDGAFILFGVIAQFQVYYKLLVGWLKLVGSYHVSPINIIVCSLCYVSFFLSPSVKNTGSYEK